MQNMKEKQKLVGRNTCTPTDAPQVRSNCDRALNREDTLSVHGLKTPSNDPDVNLPSMRGWDLRVPVINMRNEPLMPTTPRNARKLVKEGKAKVVQRTPFTIQLLYTTGETRQPVTLGIDSGYKHIGFSATTEKAELIAGEVIIRTDIPKLNVEKAMYRRSRRNRNTWYRKPRFLNRGNRKEGWLAPSMQHKVESHVRLIKGIEKIFPVSKIIIEVASFDTQKMQNPEVSGIEYQQGELQGYEIREYLLEKFHRKCAYCGKGNIPLEIEHIIPKSRGGSNRVSNLTISCHKCNQEKNDLTAEEFGYPEMMDKAMKTLKEAPFMNLVRKNIATATGCEITFGFITKRNRILSGLEKSHANDAFVIAGGTSQTRCVSYNVTQIRRNNRALQLNRKGFRPSIRRRRYPLQPGDAVIFQEEEWNVVGTHAIGKSVIIKKEGKKMDVNVKKVKLRRYGKGLKFNIQFLPPLKGWASLEVS